MASLSYRTAGESHGKAMLALVEGMPAGVTIDVDFINAELRRRQGGYGRGGRQKIETDAIDILSGVRMGRTIGSPITMMVVNRDAHLRSLEGVVFGDNPREGFVEEGRFYHPELQFQISFPAGWQVENTRTAVYAIAPDNAAQIQFKLADVPQGTTAEGYARQLAAQGLTPQSGGPITINGNRAYLALYALRDENGGAVPAIVAFIEYRQQLYEILGPMADLQRSRAPVESAIRSFDRLTNQRILAMQPDRLRIYATRQGDTLESLAARYANPRVTAADLALLNRLPTTQSLTDGRLIKVVEKGY